MFIRHSGRRAFTLVELLVVIAIIAVLIGLLLPAVQKVRESAARAKCQNNLKQLSLACHNFADDYGAFPASHVGGFRLSVNDPGTPYGSGLSWIVAILPYIEQSAINDQIDSNTAIHTELQTLGEMPYNPYNAALVNGVRLSVLRCPSSSLPEFVELPNPNASPPFAGWPNLPNGVYSSTYMAINGSACQQPYMGYYGGYSSTGVPNIVGELDLDGNTNSSTSRPDGDGILSFRGVMHMPSVDTQWNPATGWINDQVYRPVLNGCFPPYPGSANLSNGAYNPAWYNWGTNPCAWTFAQIIDGTSNTLLLAEQSDWAYDSNGAQHDVRSDQGYGWMMGGVPWNSWQTYNSTTVRYQINIRPAWPLAGVNTSGPLNTPICSPHTGAANVAFADGSVRFMSQKIALSLLQLLCDQDDGQEIPPF